MGSLTVIHGDVTLEMPTGDVMIVDPPYRDHVHASATSCGTGGLGGPRGATKRDLGFESLTGDLRAHLCALAVVARRWSLIYTDVESVGGWKTSLEAHGAIYIRSIPWVRWSQPQLSGDRPPTGCEMIMCAHRGGPGRKHWNGPGNLVAYEHEGIAAACEIELPGLDHKALRGRGKHPTEKPLDQALDLVSWFSDPDELVIDPCCGSGTTGVACALLGRRFWGCEIDGRWADAARQRGDDAGAGQLSDRDAGRVARWLTLRGAGTPREPMTAAERPAYERALRRMTDVERVKERFR